MKGVLLKGQRGSAWRTTWWNWREAVWSPFRHLQEKKQQPREHTTHGNDLGCARVLKYSTTIHVQTVDDEIAVVKTRQSSHGLPKIWERRRAPSLSSLQSRPWFCQSVSLVVQSSTTLPELFRVSWESDMIHKKAGVEMSRCIFTQISVQWLKLLEAQRDILAFLWNINLKSKCINLSKINIRKNRLSDKMLNCDFLFPMHDFWQKHRKLSCLLS